MVCICLTDGFHSELLICCYQSSIQLFLTLGLGVDLIAALSAAVVIEILRVLYLFVKE